MKRKLTIFISLLSMLALILDGKYTLSAAQDGIELCIKTVIPALFPYILISTLLTAALVGIEYPILRPIGKLLRIPVGFESLWLIGFLSGYPVGARCVAQATRSGCLGRTEGNRLLSFCSNPGPSFIFGIGLSLLQDIRLCFVIWIIQIISSFVTGLLTPRCPATMSSIRAISLPSLPEALHSTVSTLANICGWVVLFRIGIGIADKWLFWRLPSTMVDILWGIAELTNGCARLSNIDSIEIRFLLFSLFLSFGGSCVVMQTWSVIHGSGLGMIHYLTGKMCQCACTAILSVLSAWILFPGTPKFHFGYMIPPILIVSIYSIISKSEKLKLENLEHMDYNHKKIQMR